MTGFNGGGVWFEFPSAAIASGPFAPKVGAPALPKGAPGEPGAPDVGIVFHRLGSVAVYVRAFQKWERFVCSCRVPLEHLSTLSPEERARAHRWCMHFFLENTHRRNAGKVLAHDPTKTKQPEPMEPEPMTEPTPFAQPPRDFPRSPEADLKLYPILRFFSFGHLPAVLQQVSAPFKSLAFELAANVFADPVEMEVALRKLLEAKDAAVRAMVTKR